MKKRPNGSQNLIGVASSNSMFSGFGSKENMYSDVRTIIEDCSEKVVGYLKSASGVGGEYVTALAA